MLHRVVDGFISIFKEMQTYFDAIPGGDAVLGDLAMIINDPHSANTLVRNIFNLLVEIVDQGIPQPFFYVL